MLRLQFPRKIDFTTSLLRMQSTKTIMKERESTLRFPSISDISQSDLISEDVKSVRTGHYFIERSETGNLPVYSDVKSGGTNIITEIRKIRGDPVQLRNDLQILLPMIPKENWRVNTASNKIIVKGNYVKPLKMALSKNF